VGAKDWRVVRELAEVVDLDWVMLACSLTVFHHPPEVVDLVASLHERGIGIINSAVFHAGFLTGGKFFDYRELRQEDPADRPFFAWREKFHALLPAARRPTCRCPVCALPCPLLGRRRGTQHQSSRASATEPDLANAEIPAAFWTAMRDARLISPSYPYLG